MPQGQCAKVSSINDKSDWKVVRKALTVIGFTEDEVEVRLSVGARPFLLSPRENPRLPFTACFYSSRSLLSHALPHTVPAPADHPHVPSWGSQTPPITLGLPPPCASPQPRTC